MTGTGRPAKDERDAKEDVDSVEADDSPDEVESKALGLGDAPRVPKEAASDTDGLS